MIKYFFLCNIFYYMENKINRLINQFWNFLVKNKYCLICFTKTLARLWFEFWIICLFAYKTGRTFGIFVLWLLHFLRNSDKPFLLMNVNQKVSHFLRFYRYHYSQQYCITLSQTVLHDSSIVTIRRSSRRQMGFERS
jgi:hypothetical protein